MTTLAGDAHVAHFRFPNGYASGPTTGAGSCGDAGGPVDAGPTFPCGTLGQKCSLSDEYCMLSDGTVEAPGGGTGTERQCNPTPADCGSAPTCTCVEKAVYPASSVTGCTEGDGGIITVNVTQRGDGGLPSQTPASARTESLSTPRR